MFESKSGIMFVAGLAFFAFAFLSNAVVPMLMYQNLPEKTAEQLVNGNLRYQFEDLQRRYPDSFKKAYGEVPTTPEQIEPWYNQKVADTLRVGRKLYVGEGCWHCHSQFVRPVSNEEERFGAVSRSWEYQNELQRPVMFGTRRVGPDLSREGGRRSNDWHAVHFFNPQTLSEGSPMPSYPWFFDGSPDRPTARGLALITYIQWLGSWRHDYPDYEQYEASPLPKKEVATPANEPVRD
jgi:cytochrome c oxidase cbb3-type subunit 2